MKKEYIIVDTNNNWLSSTSTLREAYEDLKELAKTNNSDCLYLYRAEELKRIDNRDEI